MDQASKVSFHDKIGKAFNRGLFRRWHAAEMVTDESLFRAETILHHLHETNHLPQANHDACQGGMRRACATKSAK